MGRVHVVGMAGGIGAGKSTVAAELRKLGAEVLNADAMVHELLRTAEVMEQIVGCFGEGVLDDKGRIDRRKLGARAFDSEDDVRELERILHPAVVRRTEKRIAELKDEPGTHVVVIDAPLLFEAGMDVLCDSVVFVEAGCETRRERVRQTRGWEPDELQRREKRQKPLDYKRRNADFVIRNDLSQCHMAEQIRTLWSEIQQRLQP